jgi:hypothetical protein
LNGGGAISILAIAVPAAIVVLLCCLAMVCWWTRRRQVELRRADVNNWLRNMSMSTVVFQPEARKARAIQKAVMVTVTADPEPDPAFATTAPKPNSGSELELMTFNSGAADPVSSKHAQAPRAQGVNLEKLNSYVHHPDHYL